MRAKRRSPIAFLLAVLLVSGLSLRCSEDPSSPVAGGIDLLVDWGGYAHRGGEDTVHLEIRGSDGNDWIDPLATAMNEGEEIVFDLEIPEGTDLTVGMWIDSQNEVGRGIVAEGATGDVTVRAARQTEVEVSLEGTVPVLAPIEAAPGDVEYEVTWTRVGAALDYELLESSSSGNETFTTTDSSLTLPLTAARAEAFAGGEGLVYRVRARLERGNGLFSDPVTFQVGEVRDLPFVVSVSPEDGAEAVRDSTAPRLVFDREMDWSTLALASIELVDVESEVPVALEPEGEGSVLTLMHPADLRRGRTFRFDLSGPLADLEGRPFDQDPATPGLQGFGSQFSVEVYDPLRVIAVTPVDGAVDVPIVTAVDVTLSRAALPSSVNSGTVLLEDGEGTPVAGNATWIEADSIIRFEPSASLGYDAVYRIRVTTGVLDLRGEPLDQDPATEIPEFEEFGSTFRTEVQPVGARVLATVPIADEQNHPVVDPIVVTFDRPIDLATVSRTSTFRVLKLPVGAGIPGEIGADAERRVFTFEPTGDLEAGVRYRIDLTTGLRDDAGVPLDQFPDIPGFQGFQSEFRVEDSFGVSGVVPEDGAERVELEAQVQVTFETAVDPETLEDGTELLDGSAPVGVSRSLSPNGRTLTFVPLDPFDTFTEYTVRVDPDLRSLEGSRFDDDLIRPGYQAFESRFTTRPDSIPPRVDPAALMPADGAEGVDPEITIQVRFTKRILPASVNAETVILSRVEGEVVSGALSVSADSLTAFFTPAAPLAENREYQLDVLTWVVDRFDVRLDQDPVAPDRQAFRSTFRVDHERVAPRVQTVSPGDGLEGVSALTDVVLFFSEPMDPESLPAAFRLLSPTGAAVEGTFVTAADSVRATFTPSAPLRENRLYQVRLETTATDRWGNRLDQVSTSPELDPFVSSFRTEEDEVGPLVLSTVPADGATEVEPDVDILLFFDEPLLDATVLPSNIALFGAGEVPVPVASLEQVAPGEVRLVPLDPLETSTDYLLTVNAGLTDTLGNPFDQIPGTPEADPLEVTFRTRLENDPPFALGTIFEDFPPPRETNPKVAMSEAIDPASLGSGDVRLLADGGGEVPIDVSFPAPDTLLVTPLVLLEALTSHELIVEGLADLAGNVFDQDPDTPEPDPFVQPFQTAQDRTPPRVIASSPEDGEEAVSPDVVISLTFSEPMKTSDFDDFTFQVVRLEGNQEYAADGEITWNLEQTRFDFTPDNSLLPGFIYEVRADYRLRDLAGNPLDQDPETPEEDVFISHFLVGDFPEAEISAAVCSDTTWVEFDASASFDPDGEIVALEFDWGDGDVTFISDPVPADYIQSHVFPCLDFAGCDGIDNDGDGALDAEDCNESYRVILRTQDDDGLWGADTSGVSFCALAVFGIEPEDGATGVDTLLREVRIDFSRPVAEESLQPDRFRIRYGGFLDLPIDSVGWGSDESEVLLFVGDTLRAGALHLVTVLDGVVDENGRETDQDPCTPEPDPFTSSFRTQSAVLPRASWH